MLNHPAIDIILGTAALLPYPAQAFDFAVGF